MTPNRFAGMVLLLGLAAGAAGCAVPQATGLLPAPPMAIRKEVPLAPRSAPPVATTSAAVPAPAGTTPAGDNTAGTVAPKPAEVIAPAPPAVHVGWKEYTDAIAKTREAIARQKPGEAVAAWKPVEDGPYRADAIFHQGVLLHLSGDINGAEAQYRRGTDQATPDPASAANLLGIYLMKGETAKARELVDRTVPAGASTASLLPELVANAGAVLLEAGEIGRAASLFDSLESRGRVTPAADWNQAIVAWRKGNAAAARNLSAKLPAETQQLWSVAASRTAWDPEAAARLAPQYTAAPGGDRRLMPLAVNFDAFARYRAGKVEEAEKLLAEASRSSGYPPELLSNLGWLQIERGKWNEGRTTLERVTREHPSFPDGWFNLGLFREIYAGDAPGAVECYRKYVSLSGYRKDEVSKWIDWLQKPAPPQ